MGGSLIVFGYSYLNNPECHTLSLSFGYRKVEETCYPLDSAIRGLIPGNLAGTFFILFGILLIAIGWFGISENKSNVSKLQLGNAIALKILGSVEGKCSAVLASTNYEGNLFWSKDSFIFILNDSFSDKSDETRLLQIGPMHFSEVAQAKFRIPMWEGQQFLIEISGPVICRFTSQSGKIKNLVKQIRKFKSDNP